MTRKIVVTGATGQVGGAVVKALTADGLVVRAATRYPGDYRGGGNVVPVKLDYHDEDTIAPALAGADGLFLIALPLDPKAPQNLEPIIDRAGIAGVRHIVLNSALNVDRNEKAPLRIVERYLMNSGIPYTILRPNFFMNNFTSGSLALMINEEDGLFLAAGEGKTSFIATRDIAAVTAAVFEQGLVSRELDLTGPEALDHHQIAAIIGKASGRRINYQQLSETDFLKLLRQRGLPDPAARYLADLYGAVRAGFMARVTVDVLKVTGRAPMRFTAFAKEHSNHWTRLGEKTLPYAAGRSVEQQRVHPGR